MRWRVGGAWLLAATAVALGAAQAQTYPAKPIRVIVPYAAGGFSDLTSRVVVDRMARTLGQPLVIEPRPGGGGRIGADQIAKSANDGYQLLYTTNGTHTFMAVTEKDLPYDPIRGFTPIALVGDYGLQMVVHPAVPAATVGELVAYAKKNPGKVNYASSGMGSGIHFAGELFNVLAGIDMVHVPYKGSGPAMQDVIAGVCQVTFDGAAKPFIDSGKVRFLGTTSAQRDPRFPNAPTIAEGGVAGFDLTYWTAFFAPAGLSPAIQTQLNTAVNAALADEPVRKRLEEMGLILVGGPPERLEQRIRGDIAVLRKIATDAKLQLH
jgi:tripartite-type tricarboxylate transporter receptor subunit TctC